MDITTQVGPPRVLTADRPLGYPLGEPHKPALQKRIMLAALAHLSKFVSEPLVVALDS